MASRSFWLQQALSTKYDMLPSLQGDLKTDICIVGGGFTGLWTAINIKQFDPSIGVVILEKDICGGGASGRNGGFCMTWMSKAISLLKITGGQEGVRLLRESENAVKDIGQFCLDHKIDCQFRLDGWIWTASNDPQIDAWQETIDKLDKLGLNPYELLDDNQLSAMTGSTLHKGGVFEKGVATVQPGMLARGLRRVASDLGVRIFENTGMLELVRQTSPGVVTKNGRVRAESIVLALNAWAHELPEFRRTVLPISATVIATKPVPEKLDSLGMTGCTAVSDSRFLVNFYRPTIDGRLVWGIGGGTIPFAGRLGTRFDNLIQQKATVASALRRFCPTLKDTEVEYSWSGPATRTSNGLPMFGSLPGAERIIFGHGYVGNGVGPSYLGGKILAAIALDQKNEWSESPLVNGPIGRRLPPEPFRFIGGKLVRAASIRVDQAHDKNTKPARLDSFLASLGPSSLTPRNSVPNSKR